MDIAKLNTVTACNAGAEIEIKHPITNVGIGVFITILGKDSDAFKEHTRDAINTRIRANAQAAKRGRDPELRTVEDTEQENLETLAICTLGWRSKDKATITCDGEELAFTQANAKKIYAQFPFIYAQVNEGIANLENFMQA